MTVEQFKGLGAVSVEWRVATCYCHGGLVGGHDGYPTECRSCGGMGEVWVTENGARALWPGGPFLGRDTDHSEWERGIPSDEYWKGPSDD